MPLPFRIFNLLFLLLVSSGRLGSARVSSGQLYQPALPTPNVQLYLILNVQPTSTSNRVTKRPPWAAKLDHSRASSIVVASATIFGLCIKVYAWSGVSTARQRP